MKTAVALQTFILACIMHPKWIHEAQKQIDDIVGPDRLPIFVDRPRLPYIDAIVRGRCIYCGILIFLLFNRPQKQCAGGQLFGSAFPMNQLLMVSSSTMESSTSFLQEHLSSLWYGKRPTSN